MPACPVPIPEPTLIDYWTGDLDGSQAESLEEQGAPTISQLNDPLIDTPNVPVFDFRTGETVFVTRVSGGIGWSEPQLTVAPVRFDLDLARGLSVSADNVTVEITDPIERYLTRNDQYDLGGTPNILSTVWIPCRAGMIAVDGVPLPGAIRLDATKPISSAFIAEAEVWCTADHPRK